MHVYLPGERGGGPMLRAQGAEEGARPGGSAAPRLPGAGSPAGLPPPPGGRPAPCIARPPAAPARSEAGAARLGSARHCAARRDAPGGKGAGLRARCRSPNFGDRGRRGGMPLPPSAPLGPGTRSAFDERNGNARGLPPRWGRGGGGEKWYSKTVSCFVLF